MPQAAMRTTIVEVVHVTIACGRPFETVRDALVKDVPAHDPEVMKLLIDANAAEIEKWRATGPKLWLFETRDHGALVAAEGHAKKAIQFEIGNPLTAERMTRHRLAAGLYAPLRIVLYDHPERVRILPAEKIADDGLAIGLGGSRLDIGQAGFVVVQDQVDGDVVGRPGHAMGHGTHSQKAGLNSRES
jgi:hypothetical protein